MSQGGYILLEDRGVITLTGKDRIEFLQGLVSADISKLSDDHGLWSALLTAQGKFLHEFFLAAKSETIWLDCESDRLMDLGQRLRRYKLRSEIDLGIGQDLGAFALPDVDPALFRLSGDRGAARGFAGGVVFVDPRLPEMGLRAIGPRTEMVAEFENLGLTTGLHEDYDRRRIHLGLPDGSKDMIVEKATLLENGFDELEGVDWNKGCYMGQELTARMRYRGLVKKRLLPFHFSSAQPLQGDQIQANGKEVAEIRSQMQGEGLALVRLDRWRAALEDAVPLMIGDVEVTIDVPNWMTLPEPKSD